MAASPAPGEHRHPACRDVDDLLAECAITRHRGSGPGGQHRNKVETGVRIIHEPTGIEARAEERREQAVNRRHAIARLRLALALHHRSAVDPASYRPSRRLANRIRPGGRLELSRDHADFPAVLAEVLDLVEAHAGDVRAAARSCGLTASQIVRLLRREPRALALVNERRRRASWRPLR